MSVSLVESLVSKLGPERIFNALSVEERVELMFKWEAYARPEQIAPPWDWRTWLILAGRGFGKTRTGSEWVRNAIHKYAIVNLVGATADDARDIMVEGESGILAVCPNDERPRYLKSSRQLNWPNGAKSLIFTADEPDRLRGKQHMAVWGDELASWRYEDSWVQMRLGLRLGSSQACVTTTPRPIPLLRQLIKDPTTAVTRGSTYDNKKNLSGAFVKQIIAQYEGTRLGRQELHAELLEDVEGALWNHGTIDKCRRNMPLQFQRIVVAVDPSGSAKKTADEAGIVVAGLSECACLGRVDTHAFVLEDLTGRYSPREMGEKAIAAYHRYRADLLVAEDNFGGQIVKDLVQLIDGRVNYKAVRATRGKIIRAEPIAALYEQSRVHHVGFFPELESEMSGYAPLTSTESPGRLDACIAKGSPVLTRRGNIPIENVMTGDTVWTRQGWKRVLASRLTRRNAAVKCLRMSDGSSLIATADHKILRENMFVALDALVCGDTITQYPKPALVSVVGIYDASEVDVYDLMVADAHEFCVNGMIVHNCVWAVTNLMLSEPVTLGEGPVASGAWRNTEPAPASWDDDEDDSRQHRGQRW